MSGKTIVSELERLSREKPDKPAFVFVDKTWKRTVLTRLDVWQLSQKFASILHQNGVERGDIVCNTLPNSPERVITMLGTMVCGAPSMQGQLLLADGSDLKLALNTSKCKAILIDSGNPHGARDVLASLEVKGHDGEVRYESLLSLEVVIPCSLVGSIGEVGSSRYIDTIRGHPTMYKGIVEPDDMCVIFTTSGSTGYSKLVPQPHHRVLEITRIFSKVLTVSEEDVYYNDRQLGWSAGFPYFSSTLGSTRVLTDASQGVAEDEGRFIWELVSREKCTSSYMVPVQIENIIKTEENWKNSGHKLRTIGTGGGPLTKYQMASIGKITEGVSTSYGASECCSISYFIVKDKDSYENCNNGWPSEGVEVKIVDDKLQEVPQGEFGEIICRSAQTATHYLNDESNSRETFLPEGWLRLGDLGHMNSQGQVFVFCRKSYAIMMGPFIVYPGWLEIKIKQCPGIQSVVLVGVPHPLKHQELCACVVCEPGEVVTEAELHEFCKGLFLTPEGSEITPLPSYYLFFQDYPRSPNGKLNRKAVRAEACQRLGLEHAS